MMKREQKHTFVGSRLTRPQARAATPLQLCETAMIPMESGPGCKGIHAISNSQNNIQIATHGTIHSFYPNNCITFIPTICTQSTAVPVAFDRNSAKVSSAIASRLPHRKGHRQIYLQAWKYKTVLKMLGAEITQLGYSHPFEDAELLRFAAGGADHL